MHQEKFHHKDRSPEIIIIKIIAFSLNAAAKIGLLGNQKQQQASRQRFTYALLSSVCSEIYTVELPELSPLKVQTRVAGRKDFKLPPPQLEEGREREKGGREVRTLGANIAPRKLPGCRRSSSRRCALLYFLLLFSLSFSISRIERR